MAPDINIQSELDETQKALREIKLMIDQSQGEMTKLSQRNASITTHLQQIQGQIGSLPANEIRLAYDSALDAQQRLLVMRGQLEKLQNDKTHLEKYAAVLNFSASAQSGSSAHASSASSQEKSNSMGSIEMVINAQESERQRLSRQMHDGPAQAMSNFIIQTEIAMRLLDADPAQAKEELSNLKGAAMGTFQKVRNFIFELRPMMLDDLGLLPTVKKYVDAFKEQTSLDVNLSVTGTERRIEAYLEVMVFRALQELLGNASRHSQATLIKVMVDMTSDSVKVSVDDNGKGFDAEKIKAGGSLGLRLIRERVEMLGGSFEIDSASGKGARVSFMVPARS